MDSASNHQCMIYTGSPSIHLTGLAILSKQKLNAGWRCLYLNAPALVGEMRSRLSAVGVAVEEQEKKGAFILSSDQGHLRDGRFDMNRMLGMIEDAIEDALQAGYAGLWATGDMCWEFGSEKDYSKLLEYEYALERLCDREPKFGGICQYHAETLPNDAVNWGLLTHRAVYINDAVSQPNPYYAPETLLTYRQAAVPKQGLQSLLAHLQHPAGAERKPIG